MTANALRTNSSEPSKLSALLSFAGEFRWPLVILAAHLPMLAVHLRNMSYRPQHQYFPLVFVTVAVLIWSRLQPPTVETRSRRALAHLMFTVAIALLLVGTLVVFSPWVAAVAFVIACGAAMLLLAEHYAVQNLFGIWIILWLLVPLPGAYEQQLSYFLQRETTVISGSLLEKIGVPNFVEGTVLSLPGRQLFVEEACSGIVSMMTIIASCLILAVWSNRAWLHTVLLVLCGLALAAITNILRVVALSVSEVKFGVDISSGWAHDLLGLCLFLIAIVLALSADQLLRFFLTPIAQNAEYKDETLGVQLWNWLTQLGSPSEVDWSVDRKIDFTSRQCVSGATLIAWVALFSVAGMTSVYAIATRNEIGSEFSAPEFASQLDVGTLSPQFNDWHQTGFSTAHSERLFAQHSKVWTFRSNRGDLSAVFSFDFSFDHFHDLCVCYESVGWTQSSPPDLMQPLAGGEAVYLRSHFTKSAAGQFGLLLNCCVDKLGRAFDPPAALSVAETVRRRLQKGNQTVYQMQLWVTAGRPMDANDERMIRELFEHQRRVLLEFFSTDSNP